MRYQAAIVVLVVATACRGENALSLRQGALAFEGLRLGEPTLVSDDGFYLSPRFSPDSRLLAFAGPKYEGLYVARVDKPGLVTRISDEDFVGWAARWTSEGIETRTRDGRVIVFRNPVHGQVREVTDRIHDPKASFGPIHVYHENDKIHLVRDGTDRVISDSQDRYFAPLLSPDQKRVVYEGLLTGLWLFEIESGETVHVGRGNHPAWLSNSEGFLFDVTEDDGLRLTSGEIYAYFVKERRRVPLTDTPGLIETNPAPSPDGRLVAFESEGKIYVAPVLYSQ